LKYNALIVEKATCTCKIDFSDEAVSNIYHSTRML